MWADMSETQRMSLAGVAFGVLVAATLAVFNWKFRIEMSFPLYLLCSLVWTTVYYRLQASWREDDLMDLDDMMPVGDCCVCGRALDHRQMGNCGECGSVFHWDKCGSWGDSDHRCNNCKGSAEDSSE